MILLKGQVANTHNFIVINECISSLSNAYQVYILPLDFWLIEIKRGVAKESSATRSRLTIMSCEAKKKQQLLSELFTWTTTKRLGNALAKLP